MIFKIVNIYFRTNFNSKHGIGHFVRVLNLVKKLKINYFCKIILDNNQIENKFKNFNFSFDFLYKNNSNFRSEQEDAINFCSKIKKNSIVIVDDYRLGFKWEKIVSQYTSKLVVICDDYTKKHYADILINTKSTLNNPDNKILHILKNVNKNNCRFLLGHEYAFVEFLSKTPKQKKNFFVITFYNGGAGSLLVYLNLIKFIFKNKKLINKNFLINVIVGPLSKNKKKVLKVFSKIKGVKVIIDKLDLSNELSNTDLMISSSGLMFYESSYYKIPTIFIKMAENQSIDNYSIQKFGQIIVLDKKDLAKANKMGRLIIVLVNNYKRLKNYLSNPQFVIDDKGLSRIIKKILE